MGKKYIIELERGETAYKTVDLNGAPLIQLLATILYTEPDLEQVRKEAYDNGYATAKHECEDCQKIRADAEQELADKAYQKGLFDAWKAARKIASDNAGQNYSIFGQHVTAEILNTHSAFEAIEEIRSYEQAQKEKEEQEEKDSVAVEEVMRQYLDMFCRGRNCTGCVLNEHDFTCGRGRHFLTSSPVSDEEVRRAYTTVLQKMRETNDNK